MNHTELNLSISQTNCNYFLQLSQDHFIGILILRIYYPLTALIIVISNGLLLQTFSKKTTKTRADKMFTILSSSDFGVGLISVPVVSLMLFITDCDILNVLSPAVECFALFPYGFSWALIVIVALDRVLIITKGHIYKKNYHTKGFKLHNTYCTIWCYYNGNFKPNERKVSTPSFSSDTIYTINI